MEGSQVEKCGQDYGGRRDVAILNKLFRVGFTGKVVFKQKLE